MIKKIFLSIEEISYAGDGSVKFEWEIGKGISVNHLQQGHNNNYIKYKKYKFYIVKIVKKIRW